MVIHVPPIWHCLYKKSDSKCLTLDSYTWLTHSQVINRRRGGGGDVDGPGEVKSSGYLSQKQAMIP